MNKLKFFEEAIDMSQLEYLEAKLEMANNQIGNLANNKNGELVGYNCIKCKNKGYFIILKNFIEYHCPCNCMQFRKK